jgi:hypothetical protein
MKDRFQLGTALAERSFVLQVVAALMAYFTPYYLAAWASTDKLDRASEKF